MRIADVSEIILPLFVVETYSGVTKSWGRFTLDPFETQEDAENHRQQMLRCHTGIKSDKIRVGPYTAEMWRRDLIDAIEEGGSKVVRQALASVSSDELAAVLHSQTKVKQ